MSEQREKIEHPSWCDQSRCTAPEVRPVAGDAKNGDPYGQHLSAVISLSGQDVENGLEICMLKAVAPWDTGVFLCFRTSNGDRRWQTEVDSGGYGMALFDLLAAQIAVDARQYPALFGERYGWVADGILGDADEAAAAAGPVELFPADVWKDAPAPDPATRLGLPPEETFVAAFEESMARTEGEWENLPGVTDTYPSTAISDNVQHRSTEPDEPFDVTTAPPELQEALRRMSARGHGPVVDLATGEPVAKDGKLVGEDQEDVVDRDDPRTYQVAIDHAVKHSGPFRDVRTFIAAFVTRLLEADEGLALDAQTVNLAFNMGGVQRALDQDGEWSTLFGAGTRHPKHIKVTVTDGS
ncbi:hypothetical protein ABZ341_41675 [Streptomyces sp. NPDC006173]|uniref:hypothetical protein n=1 Tax=Streptomyces sp. NPDC006173 TaxID=3155349 RepID=UPI0033FA79DB